jgi:hypothetical protein
VDAAGSRASAMSGLAASGGAGSKIEETGRAGLHVLADLRQVVLEEAQRHVRQPPRRRHGVHLGPGPLLSGRQPAFAATTSGGRGTDAGGHPSWKAYQAWICRCQLNGPHEVGVELFLRAERGSIVSFSHSSGNVEPWTTMRWKFGTS